MAVLKAIFKVALCVLALWWPLSVAHGQAPRAEQLKAVVLFRLAEFVNWPDAVFPSANSPLVIGVLGRNPFGEALDVVARAARAQGRPVVVRYYQQAHEVEACHMLFISGSDEERLENMLAALKGRSILTVSDAAGFAEQGGMVRLRLDQNRIKLRINWDAAKQANLQVNPKLLRIAEIAKAGN